jgi:hypothetical protein
VRRIAARLACAHSGSARAPNSGAPRRNAMIVKPSYPILSESDLIRNRSACNAVDIGAPPHRRQHALQQRCVAIILHCGCCAARAAAAATSCVHSGAHGGGVARGCAHARSSPFHRARGSCGLDCAHGPCRMGRVGRARAARAAVPCALGSRRGEAANPGGRGCDRALAQPRSRERREREAQAPSSAMVSDRLAAVECIAPNRAAPR